MDTQHLAAFRTQACQIVIPSQSYLGIAMKFTLYLIMAHTGQFIGKVSNNQNGYLINMININFAMKGGGAIPDNCR